MPDTDADEVEATEIELDDDLAQRLLDAQQAYDEVKEYLDDLKDQVKAQYADHDRVIGTHGGQKVFNLVRTRSTRLNQSRFKRDWPDLYEQYLKPGAPSVSMTITRPKADS